MLLAIDIGNTSTYLGLYRNKKLKGTRRISTRGNLTVDEYWFLLKSILQDLKVDRDKISAIALSSVVPSLTTVIDGVSKKYLNIEPLIVDHNLNLGIKIDYYDPSQVGADRICNVVAAYTYYGGPTVIIDFGTATTFDFISEDGSYPGGIIVPGILISLTELQRRAARLPKIEVRKPLTLIGRSTEESMRAGVYYGLIGEVNEIIKRMKQEIGDNLKIIVTGGLFELIIEDIEFDAVEPDLTLKGLRIIYERNKTKNPL